MSDVVAKMRDLANLLLVEGRVERSEAAEEAAETIIELEAEKAMTIALFPGVTKLKSNPDLLLQDAIGKLESAVIIGFTKDGDEYFNTSEPDGADVLWLIERTKKKLLEVPDRE
jgi:hypothetical protein